MSEYIEYNEYDEYNPAKVWANMLKNHKRIHASEAIKTDGPFYCPETHEELVVRKCIEKIDHFAYKSRLSPTANKESNLHFDCKTEICNALKEVFPDGKWEVERPILENKEKGLKKVIPDISGRFGTTKDPAVIVEVQASTLSIKTILTRTEEYTKRNANILWILPLEEDLGTKLFRPRLFERYLHSMYYGRVYYWQRGNGTLLQPVHYGTAEKYIELNTWYEEGGEERCEGDYYKSYKRLKKPIYESKIDILKDFEFHLRPPFEVEDNEQKNVPECRIFKDKLQIWWTDKPARYKTVWMKNEDNDDYISELIEEEY